MGCKLHKWDTTAKTAKNQLSILRFWCFPSKWCCHLEHIFVIRLHTRVSELRRPLLFYYLSTSELSSPHFIVALYSDNSNPLNVTASSDCNFVSPITANTPLFWGGGGASHPGYNEDLLVLALLVLEIKINHKRKVQRDKTLCMSEPFVFCVCKAY